MDEVNKGRTARMNEQANILFNFDISSSISGQSAGKIELSLPPSYLQSSLYAALARRLYTREGFELLGRRLAAIARHANAARQMDVVEQASQLMLALPLSEKLKAVAHHYQALYIWRQGDVEGARQILGRVIDTASPLYQARGLSSIGATYFVEGDFEASLSHYFAATCVAREHDIPTFVTAQRMIAVVRSIYGDHRQALADLEGLFPLARTIGKYHPTCYYGFLNSYAVELGEAGYIKEAQNVCAVALASTFAAAYPEIAQTRDELEAKRTAATPSVVAVPAAIPEIIPASEAQAEAQAEPEPEPARARSTIYLKIRRACLSTRLMAAMPEGSVITCTSRPAILDRLSESTLPRGPPALP
jgi:tetratricopeptide (TPR) repeat protein